MEDLRKKNMRERLMRLIGGNEAGNAMIEIILKANFEGFTEEETERYKKQKEEEIAYFRERLDAGASLPVDSKTIYGEILSNDNLDESNRIETVREIND